MEARLDPMRLCLVTPFAWSQPHDVNEHVAGIATELRGLGHAVTILASSNRAKDLAAGRRALLDGLDAEVVVLGPAVPISRRSRMGVPVGARARPSRAVRTETRSRNSRRIVGRPINGFVRSTTSSHPSSCATARTTDRVSARSAGRHSTTISRRFSPAANSFGSNPGETTR